MTDDPGIINARQRTHPCPIFCGLARQNQLMMLKTDDLFTNNSVYLIQ